MKATLDRALAPLIGPISELRAVVLSIAPDGLLAWCWSRDDKPEVALNFAALDRAATTCLEDLGASQRGRSLLLTAEDTWVASWPLFESATEHEARPRLVITTMFSGQLQSGMVMLHGTRIRMQLRAVLTEARRPALIRLRQSIGEQLLASDDPVAALDELATEAGLELRRLTRLERLGDHELQKLEVALRRRPIPSLVRH